MTCEYYLNHSKCVYRVYYFNKETICISFGIKWLRLIYKYFKFNNNDIMNKERYNKTLNC